MRTPSYYAYSPYCTSKPTLVPQKPRDESNDELSPFYIWREETDGKALFYVGDSRSEEEMRIGPFSQHSAAYAHARACSRIVRGLPD